MRDIRSDLGRRVRTKPNGSNESGIHMHVSLVEV